MSGMALSRGHHSAYAYEARANAKRNDSMDTPMQLRKEQTAELDASTEQAERKVRSDPMGELRAKIIESVLAGARGGLQSFR